MAILPGIFSTPLLVVMLGFIVNAEEKNRENSTNPADSEYRLPRSIVPDTYNLKITNIDFGKFIFNGTSTITAKAKEPVKEIVINAGSISVYVNSILENGENIEVVETTHNDTTEMFKIILSKNVTVTSTLQISLSFGGKLRDDMQGFYKSSYYDAEGKQRWLASTQFQTTSARHAFPCFDEPEYKAEFEIGIRVPDGYNCLSNMNFTLDETKSYCRFKKSVRMSTYLVAFVISDFQSDSNKDSSLKLWARPSAENQTFYGQEIGVKALRKFTELFGQNYYEIMDKMDMVAVPDFSAGAMENWGLITFREAYGLYDADQSSDANQQRIATVIVHECSHMWFGNLVTPKWWTYLWLSEAFAVYFEYIGTNMITDNWKLDEQFIIEQYQVGMATDSVGDIKPMTYADHDVVTLEQMQMSDSRHYKGASIVRMMEKIFGTDAFYNSLKSYIQARKFESATPDDVWKAFQKFVEPELDVATILKSWTEQAGYPCITVTVETDSIKLRQNHFLLHPNSTTPMQLLWWVPITVSSSSSPSESTKPVLWLSEPEGKLQRNNDKDDWLIINVESTGFYRVNYDEDSWEKIINILTTGDFNKIQVVNRAAIVDDLLNLVRAKLIDYQLVFRALDYLKRETHYLPFKTAFTGLDYLTRVTADSSGYEYLKEYVMSLIKNIYDNLTFDDKPEDDRLSILLRQELNNRACGFGDASCILKSQNYFNELRTNNKSVPKNQRSVVYCTAVKHGSADDWEYLYKRYLEAGLASEQITILKALACSEDAKILEKYLKNTLSGFEISRIRKQDISTIYSEIYKASVKNAEFMIDFADKNHQVFYNYDKNYDRIGSIITGTLKMYPIERFVNKVEKIIEVNATHIAPNAASIKKSLDFVKQEIDLFNEHLLPVINSLK